ncbi:Glycoside hydrolase family 44 [Clostridium bornimense]|uniref:Glycoside hydrolase family 44 n=1 Tax=Clostridium bornimense TaxID=1216932 RepID=W6S7M7_9CLOT|nr:glycoside hydrolase family 44 protein [Clostridium bornimense]CDM70397.1 Glycoside hydrolase family 44 [Clostridium bornimense]
MKNKRLLSVLLSTTLLTSIISSQFTMASSETFDVNISVNTKEDRTKISPYIYGTNFDDLSATVNSRRFGGNRLTAYNWENNASSAGSDWNQSSDNHLVNGLSSSKQNEPGAAVTDFHDTNIKNDIDYSLVTLQMAGYVAKDTNGTVNEWEKAPSNRWAEVKVSKGSSLSTTPNTNDNYVYMDEFINFLVTKYGKSNTTKGIKGYSLDNEPALWSENHPRIHSNKVTCSELISKSVELSKALKKIDSNAETFGPALYGFSAYDSLQDASDWGQYKNDYDWFIDYYLDEMKK